MPIQLIDTDASEWCIPKNAEDVGYLVQNPSGSVQLHLLSSAEVNGDRYTWRGPGALALARMVVKDWRGIVDAKGQPVKFDPQHLDRIPAGHLIAICNQALAMTNLGEVEKKA